MRFNSEFSDCYLCKIIDQVLISQKREYQKEIRVPANIQIRPGKDEYVNVVPFLKT